jgi:carboxypeptidase Q
LQDSIKIDNLLKHAQALESIAYSTPGRNRAASTLGHNKTIEYIKTQLEALDGYYSVEVQPWSGLTPLSKKSTFSVNGVEYESLAIEYSTNASLTNVPLVPVANFGCNAVSIGEQACPKSELLLWT